MNSEATPRAEMSKRHASNYFRQVRNSTEDSVSFQRLYFHQNARKHPTMSIIMTKSKALRSLTPCRCPWKRRQFCFYLRGNFLRFTARHKDFRQRLCAELLTKLSWRWHQESFLLVVWLRWIVRAILERWFVCRNRCSSPQIAWLHRWEIGTCPLHYRKYPAWELSLHTCVFRECF